MDSTHPTGTHGPHCTRCGVEDDSIVLDSEGGPDLCASCASDRPPPSPDRAVGPTLPDGPVAGRAALVEHASTPTPSSPGVDAAALPAGPVPPVGRSGGAALGEMTAAEAMDAVIALRAAGDAEGALRAHVGLADGWAKNDGGHVRVGSAYSTRTPDHAPGTQPLGCALCRGRR